MNHSDGNFHNVFPSDPGGWQSGYGDALAFWRQKLIETEAELAQALEGKTILYAYHSGKIENARITFHDTREIFEHDGVTSYTGDLRTLFEIRNAKEAHGYFLSAFGKKLPLDETFLLQLHEILTKNTYDSGRYRMGERPGMYKIHDYVTGRDEIGAAPEEVKEEMAEMLAELQEIPDDKVMTAAAYFHAKFENIHPFADGNGRVGRLAMNYLLVMQDHPPVIIHEEDRRGYYDALEIWDRSQELAPMIRFLKEQTAKTWKKQVERFRNSVF